MSSWHCSECNKELREGTRFCPNCGFPVGQKEADLLFGRSKECLVRLSSPRVSRRHARAVCVGGVWYLRDEESKNGTFVNGNRISSSGWRQLKFGDRVKLAEVVLQLTPQGWVDEEGRILWPILPPPQIPCPFCQTHLPEEFLLTFCLNCGYPLQWVDLPRTPKYIPANQPSTLTLKVEGISKEPLEIVFRSEQPKWLLLGIGETQGAEVRCSCRVGEELTLRLLPQSLKEETEVTIIVHSLFYPEIRGNWRPEFHPRELEREKRIVLRLVPVRLRWEPPLVLLSYRHLRQSVRLINESPFSVVGKLKVPDPLMVYPSEDTWSLAPKEGKEWQVETRREWAKEQPCKLVAEPDGGEVACCTVFWGGGEKEVRQPDVVIGVDFGTAKSALATLDFRQDSPHPQLLALQGQQAIPSLLLFLKGRQEPLIGRDAEARLGDPDALPVQGVKLLLRSDQTVYWTGGSWTSLQLTQRFLAFLKRQVESALGDEQQCLKRFELGLPVLERNSDYEMQRIRSIKAAEEAGMKWVRVWLEPVCAAAFVLHRWRELARELPLPRPGNRLLVMDWGAGTLDAALLVYEKPEPPFFELPPLIGVGLEQGGQLLDWHLTCEFAESVGLEKLLAEAKQLGWKEFRWRGSLPLQQLAEAIREAKEQLGGRSSFTVADFRSRLTAPEFAHLDPRVVLLSLASVNEWVRRVLAELKRELDCYLSPSDWQQIAYALITGGTGQIPLVRDLIGDWIGKTDRVIQLQGEDAIFAVAYGAALIGEVRLTGIPFAISLSVNGERDELLRSGDHITCVIKRTFNVPLEGLRAELLAKVQDTDYLLASFQLEHSKAKRVQMELETDEESWLWWRWRAGETLLEERRLLALP